MTEKHNRLQLVKTIGHRNWNYYGLWRCDCGNEHEAQMAKVRSGKIKSCGCIRKGVHATGFQKITPFQLATMRWT